MSYEIFNLKFSASRCPASEREDYRGQVSPDSFHRKDAKNAKKIFYEL